jgi:bifunctional UDP-N-acetylglucosamine pyrophosphorylase / glucosamine-1-phosphate N-acetyltransferase
MGIRAILLAAGKGTRMKSRVAKVLHELCGRPMLWYSVRALRAAGIDDIVVVTNEELQQRIGEFGVRGVVQGEQLGTGHAVQIALAALEPRADGRIVVAYGDMPLITPDIFRETIDALHDGERAAMAMVTVKMPLPSNFGRVVRGERGVERIVEVRDASADELTIDEMNAGTYAFDEKALREAVAGLRNDNAQKEYYLTDAVAHFVGSGRRVNPVPVESHVHTLGINDRVELALARREMNERLCAHYMRDGVTIVDPSTTYLEPELEIGRDTVIYPNTQISLLSKIGEQCVIGPNSRLSAASIGDRVEIRESVISHSRIGSDSHVGPYAHVRGHADVAGENRIGNFVEVKNSRFGRRVKAAHLSYLGDATIGDDTNVGAGTITCNWDGERKNSTTIGKGAFIGTNTSIVAPRTIGDGALTGAGSVVTKDVPAGERVAGNPAKPLPKKP